MQILGSVPRILLFSSVTLKTPDPGSIQIYYGSGLGSRRPKTYGSYASGSGSATLLVRANGKGSEKEKVIMIRIKEGKEGQKNQKMG
jgi:hypothetical protein